MFLILRPGCSPEDRNSIVRTIEGAGLAVEVSEGHHRIVVGVVGDEDRLRDCPLETYPGVENVFRFKPPYRFASRESHPDDSVIAVGDSSIGGERLAILAGPCAVEDEETLTSVARSVKAAGATLLRGGAFKPRTSPYDFRGLGERGLVLLHKVGREVGLPIVTEAMDTRHLEHVAEHADMIQIGTRNMQNYPLLEEAARTDLPVILKRGRACTISEWLCAAEYLLNAGNSKVVLCERGLVSFDSIVRNHLDLSCVPLIKRLSHLPVIVDPSHGTGRRELVAPMARASVAAGADGVMVEVHPDPSRARSDARQAILPAEFEALVPQLHAIREVLRTNPVGIAR